MNRVFKMITAAVLLCMIAMTFVGCGYEEMPAPSKEYELKEINGEVFSFSYPAEGWEEGPEYSMDALMLAVVDSETKGDCNVTVQLTTAYDGRISKAMLNELKMYYADETVDGVNLILAEMRKYNGRNIVYFEQETALTDDILDLLIEEKGWTEEDIDSFGGREAIKESESFKQMGVYYIAGGCLCISIGTYADDSHKEEVLDIMKLAMDTTHLN